MGSSFQWTRTGAECDSVKVLWATKMGSSLQPRTRMGMGHGAECDSARLDGLRESALHVRVPHNGTVAKALV
jgi:hypothetical protein